MTRKLMILGATVALGLGMLGVATAGAAGPPKPKGKAVCTNIDGSVQSGSLTISGCTGTANTGGASMTLTFATLTNGGPVQWVSGKVTTFAKPVLGSKKATKCPGYVKKATSNPSLVTFTGAVPSDSSGMKVPGKYKGSVCIRNDAAGTISAPKAFKVN